jgi:hypothetical protein
LNNKGQFSIIAALFVSVILITTVIITYSTIRDSSIQQQPQVLSAIDETNLALKQILGFTVGYYGSVLQVTGNSTYAKMLATNYLQSGLENIASIHPDWGTSFRIADESDLDICTYWFTNSSYSMGRLKIAYNFTGLGMYGLIYETSCRLDMHIEDTLPSNQTRIRVIKDEGEPLINLGKQNFEFYHYKYTSSTWELVSPSTEPIAFANGTYLIDFPYGVDPYSYVIQVEDPRGIIVVASSFSRYTIMMTWNSTLYATTAINATLIDEESFEDIWPPAGWTENGPWNKYGSQAYHGTYSARFDSPYGGSSGDLTTLDLDCFGSLSAIYVDFWYRDEGCEAGEFLLRYYDGASWDTITDLGSTSQEGQWLHYQQKVTDSQYFKSNFKIRWRAQTSQSNDDAYVDYVTVKKEVSTSVQDATIVVELLQNGTMRWLGQDLQLTTQAKPIPPVPVKAIHVNQTINSINQEVPFQIEDWASDYKIPLGLTSNASVFSSRTMLVFLVNSKVSKVTIWWNGSDIAEQTPYSYTNRYFTGDNVNNPDSGILTNGILQLTVQRVSEYGVTAFKVTSNIIGSTVTATARFMRINGKNATYGSGTAYVIHHGIVRDIVQQEAEFSGGITDSPNLYTHIVLTLPANATYYTYQLRLMFMSSLLDRTITNLCPIKITASSGQPQTENGTASGYPIVSSTTGLFYNFSSSVWQHHWSQFTSGTKGAGIMFTDDANKMLYVFDNSTSKTGALQVDGTARTIELLPVVRFPVQFTSSKDVMWNGAVVTFDGTTPIYEGSNQTGLWIIVEYPPTVTVQTEN